MTLKVETIVAGSAKIERMRDEIRTVLMALRPVVAPYVNFYGGHFNYNDHTFYWAVLSEHQPSNPCFRLRQYNANPSFAWEGFAGDTPELKQVLIVHTALPSLLDVCAEKVPNFVEQMRVYSDLIE